MADAGFIHRRLLEGAPCSTIAMECGISRQRVYQLVEAHGLPAPAKHARHPARGAFESQRNNARKRGIGWELTFEQWWTIWRESGKWEQRGKTKGCYVMARPGDLGPYKVGNVYITTHSDNAKTAQSHARRRPARPRKERHPKGGWMVRLGKRVYLGYFRTEAAADAKVAELRAGLTP